MPGIFNIPTIQGVPDYTMRTRLDGRDFNLRLLWNQRLARWSMDINDAQGVPIATGIRIVTNWPLLRYYQWDTEMPPGEMIAFDPVDANSAPPGLYEMAIGRRVELIYIATTDF